MSDEAALLAYCYENPEDDSARLVYADWLEENGDPERAEFVRIQVRRAQLAEEDDDDNGLRQREEELLVANRKRWLAEVAPVVRSKASFRRGLPTAFNLSLGELRQFQQQPCRAVVINALRLHSVGDTLRDILDPGLLARLGELDLSYIRLSEEDILALGRCPHLAGLHTLDITDAPYSDMALRSLVLSPFLGNLRNLKAGGSNPRILEILGDSRVRFRLRRFWLSGHKTPLDIAFIARGVCFSHLERFYVRGIPLTGFAEMVSSPMMEHVCHISAGDCDLSGPALAALAASPHARRLSSLSLPENRFEPEAIPPLLASPHLPCLRSLKLSRVSLKTQSLAALCLPLTELHLLGCDLTDERLMEMAARPTFAQLRALDLSWNKEITAAGIRGLLDSPMGSSLRRLDLSCLSAGSRMATTIANSPQAASLEYLNLDGTKIGPKGVEAIARSPYLGSLRTLRLRNTGPGERGARALLDSPLLNQLTTLNISENRFSPAIRDGFHKRRGPRDWTF